MLPHTPYLPPCHITWQGITIKVRYTPCWFEMPGYETAHLEVSAIAPDRAPLPFTETGYRSHFLPAEQIDSAGGPVAYVLAWLEEAAKSPAWQGHVNIAQQLTLF
jgi:hypothetical protein